MSLLLSNLKNQISSKQDVSKDDFKNIFENEFESLVSNLRQEYNSIMQQK